MIKVVEVLSDTNIGGAGRLLLTRFALSDRQQFKEEIVLPKNSELYSEFEKIGYKAHEMKYCNDVSFDAREIFSLIRYFKHTKPDIINCHGCLSARIAGLICNVPIRIYTRHCAFTPKAMMTHFPLNKINRMANKLLSTKIIAVASAAEKNLTDTGIDKSQIKVIINGVIAIDKYDYSRRLKERNKLNIPDESFVCGICARLEDCKGIDCILRAAKILLTKNSNYYFMIIGKGSAENNLKRLSESLGISDRVMFLGFISDITPYINCFDLNINSSRGTETSSLSISEGMSIGLPCVASDWGGNPYIVHHGYNGLIYPTDDFNALAECIKIISNDKKMYNRMSKNAVERYKNELNAENMARKTEELYSTLFLAKKSKQNR